MAVKTQTICIRDETLRDGIQTRGINLTRKDKLGVAIISAQILGTSNNKNHNFSNQIDLGMPEISNFQLKTIRLITQELEPYNIAFFVTGTSTEKALETMAKSLEKVVEKRKIIAPFLGISYLHRQKLGLTKLQTLKRAIKMVELAKTYCSRINFPLEGGYYAYLEEPKFVLNLLKELEELGVECVPFCDTVGTALPFSGKRVVSYGQAIREIKNQVPKLGISTHCHNDFGLAVANTIEGILIGGAEAIDGTFLGIGERCGNTSLETMLVILKNKGKDLDIRVNANIKNLYEQSKKLSKLLEISICQHFPVIGTNAFSHVAGIHQDGTLKDRRTYESFKPQKIGRRGHDIVLGSLSGRKGIKYILEKKYRIKGMDDKFLNKAILRFKNLRNLKNQDSEKSLLRIIAQDLLKEIKKQKNKKK
jgi:2-isopropylmalate synthase